MSYDRFGEPAEQDDEPPPPAAASKPHNPRCKGWVNRDKAIPCYVCKPHLHPDTRRQAMGLGEKK